MKTTGNLQKQVDDLLAYRRKPRQRLNRFIRRFTPCWIHGHFQLTKWNTGRRGLLYGSYKTNFMETSYLVIWFEMNGRRLEFTTPLQREPDPLEHLL